MEGRNTRENGIIVLIGPARSSYTANDEMYGCTPWPSVQVRSCHVSKLVTHPSVSPVPYLFIVTAIPELFIDTQGICVSVCSVTTFDDDRNVYLAQPMICWHPLPP